MSKEIPRWKDDRIRSRPWGLILGLLQAIEEIPEDERGELAEVYDTLEKFRVRGGSMRVW